MELMISKQDFVEKMKFIKTERETQRKISKAVEPIMEGFLTYNDFYQDNLIETLEMLTYSPTPKDGLIGWWVYATNFGEHQDLKIHLGKNKYSPKTPEELYDLLVIYFKRTIKI